MISDELRRRATAYHEAGHVVVGYHVGWWAGPDGIEIDAHWIARLQHHAHDGNAWRQALVGCAGWLAEHQFHGRGHRWREDAELEQIIHTVRADDVECESLGDDEATFRELIRETPNASSDELITAYREHERDCAELLGQPEIWSQVERVAAALLDCGKLHRTEIERLL